MTQIEAEIRNKIKQKAAEEKAVRPVNMIYALSMLAEGLALDLNRPKTHEAACKLRASCFLFLQ